MSNSYCYHLLCVPDVVDDYMGYNFHKHHFSDLFPNSWVKKHLKWYFMLVDKDRGVPYLHENRTDRIVSLSEHATLGKCYQSLYCIFKVWPQGAQTASSKSLCPALPLKSSWKISFSAVPQKAREIITLFCFYVRKSWCPALLLLLQCPGVGSGLPQDWKICVCVKLYVSHEANTNQVKSILKSCEDL